MSATNKSKTTKKSKTTRRSSTRTVNVDIKPVSKSIKFSHTCSPGETILMPSVGELLELRSVPLSSLVIPTYQRTELYQHDSVKAMSGKYSAQTGLFFRVTPLPDDRWNVVDGGRRASALARRYPLHRDDNGNAIMVAVQVIRVTDTSKEPLLLIKFNTNVKRHSTNAAFKARLAANEPEELLIVSELGRIDVHLTFCGGSCKPGVTNSAGAFRKALCKLGPEKFTKLIDVLSAYRRPTFEYPVSRDALRPCFILGLAALLSSTTMPISKVVKGLALGLSASEIHSVYEKLSAAGQSSNDRMILAFEQSILHGLTSD